LIVKIIKKAEKHLWKKGLQTLKVYSLILYL
jgi:hypothetical protein